MKIIKHGVKKDTNQKIFKCFICKCEFEADETEYEESFKMKFPFRVYSIGIFSICPECGCTAWEKEE